MWKQLFEFFRGRLLLAHDVGELRNQVADPERVFVAASLLTGLAD